MILGSKKWGKSGAVVNPKLYPRIARRQQRTAPSSDFRGGRPCLDSNTFYIHTWYTCTIWGPIPSGITVKQPCPPSCPGLETSRPPPGALHTKRDSEPLVPPTTACKGLCPFCELIWRRKEGSVGLILLQKWSWILKKLPIVMKLRWRVGDVH